jgi:predicted peptidase
MPAQETRVFRKDVIRTMELRYLLYLPPGYDADQEKRWPLVLFLHGAGERGEDLNRVKRQGLARRIEEGAAFPFIAVSPQCGSRRWWQTDELSALLDEIERDYRVDPNRIYVTGPSMGGYATWALAAAQPKRFAAIVPICGGGEVDTAPAIAHLPAWVFHGAQDHVVPLSESESMVNALRAHGGNPRFTVYPEANHDSWTQTYNNPELYEWLLAQKRT